MSAVAARALAGLAALVMVVLPACGKARSTPSAGSTPAPVAASTPAPVPTPNIPGAASCNRIGLGQENKTPCDRTAPTFQGEVEQAIDELLREQPAVFEDTPSGPRVVSPGRFYVGVIGKLDRRGFCAGFDGQELQVKSSNAFNDQFALVTSAGFLRSGPNIYRATCVPAAFPVAPPVFPPNNGCKLAPSVDLACAREAPVYLPDVERAIDEVMRVHPEVFDFHVRATGTDWPGVRDPDLYHQYMVQALIGQGFCAVYDSREIQVKKTSDFSEHYAVYFSTGYVRRGEGAYRSTCWPAAF